MHVIPFYQDYKHCEMTGEYVEILYCTKCCQIYFKDEVSKHSDHMHSTILYRGLNACVIPEQTEKCLRCGTTWKISQLDENQCCICIETQRLNKEGFSMKLQTLKTNLDTIKSHKKFRRSMYLLMASEIAFVVVAIHFVWMMLK